MKRLILLLVIVFFISCQSGKNNIILEDFTKELIFAFINDVENFKAKEEKEKIIITYYTDSSYYYLHVFCDEYYCQKQGFIGQTAYLGHSVKVFGANDSSSIFYTVEHSVKPEKCEEEYWQTMEYNPWTWTICLSKKDKSINTKCTREGSKDKNIDVIEDLVQKYWGNVGE